MLPRNLLLHPQHGRKAEVSSRETLDKKVMFQAGTKLGKGLTVLTVAGGTGVKMEVWS